MVSSSGSPSLAPTAPAASASGKLTPLASRISDGAGKNLLATAAAVAYRSGPATRRTFGEYPSNVLTTKSLTAALPPSTTISLGWRRWSWSLVAGAQSPLHEQ